MSPLVSLCTSAKGRLHHLQITLPQNIHWNRDWAEIEFVLLDYSSTDGLDEWIKANCGEWLQTGLLNYYQAIGFADYNRSHAKNIAHRLARGQIVCNIDADNFTGPGLAKLLADCYASSPNSFFRSANRRGAHGRISFRKEDFLALGGYDERFVYGWGYEDEDIIHRAKCIGLRDRYIPNETGYKKFFRHSRGDSTRFNAIKSKWKSSALHQQISEESIRNGHFVANSERTWGSATIIHNFSGNLKL